METFDKKVSSDLKILKQLFKYMYEYLMGDIKREM